MGALTIAGIHKSFGPFEALRGIQLNIEQGKFTCLLGPSGCGKTTLLRIIAGLEQPDRGTVHLGSRDITFLPPAKRSFGIVFQSYALFPNLTAADNIAYGLKGKMPRRQIKEKVEDMLRLVGLESVDGRYPAQLSGGQQQRVALARAIALSPEVLLLDEPLSALDAKVRVKLREQLCLLQEQLGITTIMVTHDQEEALTMADQVIVMNEGRIEQAGTPQELYDRPRTPFVADFIGAINFLPSELGSAHVAAIRPEHIAARGSDDLLPEEDGRLLPAKILHAEFRGSYYRVSLQPVHPAGQQSPVLVDVSASHAQKLDLRRDAVLHLQLPASRTLHYPDAQLAAQQGGRGR
ncbi:iron(III) transport system ATP-binding protein [Paenibacillus phyllosphaerae]|uniref:Carnitine transport ATP-binding protein OpuCA n=1 Tax=Paenibacillus phyllosphaerae TaxID=274593 RepID=A0A7W5FMW9_9BACL|nr:ATP-binding cassette domain-containing protein [Paenibacillus phyllosphaerae]MBB3110680.1 iron(III) transport system ATP-binding protein [Paenibacillus phyllosphaerae]